MESHIFFHALGWIRGLRTEMWGLRFDGAKGIFRHALEFIKENYPKHAIVEGMDVYDYNDKVMDMDGYHRSLAVE